MRREPPWQRESSFHFSCFFDCFFNVPPVPPAPFARGRHHLQFTKPWENNCAIYLYLMALQIISGGYFEIAAYYLNRVSMNLARAHATRSMCSPPPIGG